MSADWAVYCPPGTPVPEPEAACDLPRVDAPTGSNPLVVVVSSSAALAAARDIQSQHPALPVVLWAWRLAESLAADAEAAFPVIYGWPDPEMVNAAYLSGPGRTEETQALFDLESAFGFAIDFDTPTAADAAGALL